MVELLKALTPRLADSQSNLKPLAATALAEVASSVGPDAGIKVILLAAACCLKIYDYNLLYNLAKYVSAFSSKLTLAAILSGYRGCHIRNRLFPSFNFYV